MTYLKKRHEHKWNISVIHIPPLGVEEVNLHLCKLCFATDFSILFKLTKEDLSVRNEACCKNKIISLIERFYDK